MTNRWAAVPRSAREDVENVRSGIWTSTRSGLDESSALTTPSTLASVRCIVNTFVDARATLRIRGATANASNPVASAASTTSVQNLAPLLVPHVWKRVHGNVPITNAQWPVDRYVGSTIDLRFIIAEIHFQICARLPCDEPCTRTLDCGHPCPSGEFLTLLILNILLNSANSLWRTLRNSEMYCLYGRRRKDCHR